MNHSEVTQKIDRRIEKRKPEVNDGYFAKWERQWDKRYGRNKSPWNAVLFDRGHERAMQAAADAR